MTEYEVEVQIRNERLGVIFFMLSLFVAPVIAGVQSDTNFDILRAFVITQAGIIFVLYAVALAEGIAQIWRGAYATVTINRSLLKARIARIFGCMIFVAEESFSIVGRLGEPVMNFRTPVLQIALLLLLYAWAYMDRRRFEEASQALTELDRLERESRRVEG